MPSQNGNSQRQFVGFCNEDNTTATESNPQPKRKRHKQFLPDVLKENHEQEMRRPVIVTSDSATFAHPQVIEDEPSQRVSQGSPVPAYGATEMTPKK